MSYINIQKLLRELGPDPIREARQQFADANGWRIGKFFDRYRLAGVRGEDWARYQTLGDHAEYFWKDRRPVAIVAHNYPAGDGDDGTPYLGRTLTGSELDDVLPPAGDNHYGVGGIAREAGDLGLVTHVAPAGAAASWYLPNHSLLLVITRPGIKVVWPTPEQIVKNAIAHAIYRVRMKEIEEINDKQAAALRARETLDALADQDFG